MTKFIFTVTSAVASMLGQVYNDHATTVTESVKAEKIIPVDSIRCHAKKEIRVSISNKKQMPS